MKSKHAAPIIAAFVAVLWFGLGTFYRSRALSDWNADYVAAAAHSLLPLPGSQAAGDFAAAYEDLEQANVLSAPVHYFRANQAHKEWARTAR